MTTLSIDIETRSSVNITVCGTVKYAQCPDFAVLLFSFAYGSILKFEPVTTIDLTYEEIPQYVIDDLTNPDVIKTAHNAFFERTCLGRHFGIYMPPEQWRCTMIKAATLGLPLNLGMLGKALKLDTLKESEGKALIKFFSVPHALSKKDIQERFSVKELWHLFPETWSGFRECYSFDIMALLAYKIGFNEQLTKTESDMLAVFKKECINYIRDNEVMVFYQPHHDPEKWERYKHYNNTDVVVEIGVLTRIKWHNIIADEQQLWNIDQEINELGVCIDVQLVNNAIAIDAIYRAELLAEAEELTGLNNPNSATQIKQWLTKEMPLTDIDTLRKDDVTNLLKLTDGYINAKNIDQVLKIRQELSKTSIKKYFAMLNFLCADGRAHGLLQFYGANRTGRWAGRGIQFQNLRRISLKVDKKTGIDDLGLARTVVRDALKGYDGLIEWDNRILLQGFDDIEDAEIEES